jgi:hypothetical protein
MNWSILISNIFKFVSGVIRDKRPIINVKIMMRRK